MDLLLKVKSKFKFKFELNLLQIGTWWLLLKLIKIKSKYKFNFNWTRWDRVAPAKIDQNQNFGKYNGPCVGSETIERSEII